MAGQVNPPGNLHISEGLETWFNQTLSSFSPSRGRYGGGHDDLGFGDRLRRCWKLQTCGLCLSSDVQCGWCPYSSTCIPLPSASDIPLHWPPLAPLNHAHICPFDPERFDLRTKSFGSKSCNVSIFTLLTAVVSFLCGVAAVFVVLVLVWIVAWLVRRGRTARGGWEVLVVEDEMPGERWREQRVWVRKAKSWWRTRSVDVEAGERRLLLGG